MTAYTWAWIWWGVMFFVVEGSALSSKTKGQTLTSHVVRWLSLKEKSKGWLARRGGLFGFLGWLVYHFVSRIEW